MGGTKILSAVMNSEDGIIARVKKPTGKGTANFYLREIVKIIKQSMEEADIKEKQLKAICIGIPGSVNPFTGKIHVAPNLNIKNYPIKEKLQKFYPVEVLIENDVNLAALGVKEHGAAKNAKNIMVVFIGTGIGSGLIFDNKLYRGTNFAAGEIGHIHVLNNGPKCGCGHKGCIEAIASRTAMVRNIIKDYKKGDKTILSNIIEKRKPIKSKALLQAVKKKDKVVLKHIDKSCEDIGNVLANINNLLNLDMIVLGGGVIEALNKYMIPKIKETFQVNSLPLAGKHVKIVASKLKDDAALYGGLALAHEFMGIKI
jgi:glucokinase